jgi:Pterin 4 alpha carbinolamine dehydratase
VKRRRQTRFPTGKYAMRRIGLREGSNSATSFVGQVGQVAEAERHHPDITFGWGYAARGSQSSMLIAEKAGRSCQVHRKQRDSVSNEVNCGGGNET